MLALDAHAEQEQPPHPDEGRNVGVRRGVGREQPHCGARRLLREGLRDGSVEGSVEGPNEGYATSWGYRHPCRDPSIPSR